MKMLIRCFLPFKLPLVLLLLFLNDQVRGKTILEIMKDDPDLSEFRMILEQCQACNYTLTYETMTIFAPLNAAFQHVSKEGLDMDAVVQYHLTSSPKKTDQFGGTFTSIGTMLAGNPPIWITHNSGTYHNDIYVNNARLRLGESNQVGVLKTPRGIVQQVLHRIDEVLIPTRSAFNAANPVFNPSAWEFLEFHESILHGPYHNRIRTFRQRIQQLNRQSLYVNEGGETFFIPIDEGFANTRAEAIDEVIIDGHIIPRKVLFTTPTQKDYPFQTLANKDNTVRVLISFTQEARGNAVKNYVKSHTLFGDGKHQEGVVLVEIVQANIPVKNGVVHLISKPLMVVDQNIKQLLEAHADYICRVGNVRQMHNILDEQEVLERPFIERQGSVLNNFLASINELGREGESLLNKIQSASSVTVFAPCNKAMESNLIKATRENKTKWLEILKMHVVLDEKLYSGTIAQKIDNRDFQSKTMATGKSLYFNVLKGSPNKTLTVEGGGVNATVIQPDLAATNGVIHVINRVLGVPYSTVLEKLRTDPMISDSYKMGQLEGFNDQLADESRKFTYFVPSNRAWQEARLEMPSEIKKLFMHDYAYHATKTLQMHLVSNHAYTMVDIKYMTNTTPNHYNGLGEVYPGKHMPQFVELPTVRGSLRIYVEEKNDNNKSPDSNSTFFIHWGDKKIPVFRPNVQCTNGIIHVIDLPFLNKGDIRVSGGVTVIPSILGMVATIAVFMLT